MKNIKGGEIMPSQKKKEKKTCNYKMQHNIPCGRQLFDSEHCIFHSKDIEGKKDDFEDKFWKEFERQKKHEDFSDFSEFVFPGGISFEGKTFKKDVYFRFAQFSGKANFEGAKFSGEANFDLIEFYGWANFRGGQFSEKAVFEGAKFSEKADFRMSQFSGEADFEGVKFSGEADFGGAQFYEKVLFNKAKFKEDANFEDFKLEKYNSLEMFDTYFFNVRGLFEFIEENKKKFKYSKESKLELLPDNFKLILGEEVAAGDPTTTRKVRDDMFLLKFKEEHPCWFKVWWLFADCGRSFFRWALWSLIFAEAFALVFGLFYYFNPISFKSEVISFSWPGISLLYYSIVTFTTLGFGDIVPKIPVLQIIIMLEVMIGYIMLGGLISILANKLARRS